MQNKRSVAAGQLIQDLSLVAGPKPTKPFSTAHHKDAIQEFLLPLPFDSQLERTVVIKLIVQVVVLLLRGSVTRRDTSHLHVMPESHLATELIEGRSPGLSERHVDVLLQKSPPCRKYLDIVLPPKDITIVHPTQKVSLFSKPEFSIIIRCMKKFGGWERAAAQPSAEFCMNEREILSQINSRLQAIAGEVIAAVDAEAPGWKQLILSVKWADDDSGVFDVIIESTHGRKKKYHTASAAHARLIDLWDVSRQLKEPWNELLLTIAPNGTCETKFEYP